MKVYNIVKKVFEVDIITLYNEGWNGDIKSLDKYSSNNIFNKIFIRHYGNLNYTILSCRKYNDYVSFTCEVSELEKEVLKEEIKFKEIPCNSCYGEGEIEFYASRCFSEKCDKCNGSGKIKFNEL